MNRVPRFFFLLLSLVCFFDLSSAWAQAPKPGKYYEDAVDIGFKIKMPKDWGFTPPRPGEDQLIGKYTPTNNRYINISSDTVLFLHGYLVKFDRRKEASEAREASSKTEPDGDTESKPAFKGQEQELLDWLDSNVAGRAFRIKSAKETKVDKVPATEYLISAEHEGTMIHLYAMLYRLHPDVDVAVVFNGPEDNKKWRKYASAASKMAKSFKRVEVEVVELSESKADDTGLRTKKRAELEREVATTPGWKLYETGNYFVVS
ncbi:MAG: hypothetical protein ACI9F9_002266, partial [Candidatus Paceibacteria bacterium]